MIPELSLDLNIYDKPDTVDRAKSQIRTLEKQNERIIQEIKEIQKNPKNLIKFYENKLLEKINQLKSQNQNIQARIDMFNMPGFAQMTKKKTRIDPKTPTRLDLSESHNCDWERRNPFDSVDMSQKSQVSTCQNFNLNYQIDQNPLRSLEPMQDEELEERTQMTMQFVNLIKKTQKLEKEIKQIQDEGERTQKNEEDENRKMKKLEMIAQYKKKLTSLLKKLKNKEITTEKLVNYYRQIYEQTFRKLQQTTQLLQSMQSVDVDRNVDDLYAEVISLQEKIKYINQQIQRLDQKQWLTQIIQQLLKALKRLGIQAPEQKIQQKNQTEREILRERVDQLCEIILQVALLSQCEEKDRMILLKHYHQEQKENNKKIIKKMQQKQQILSKKLIDMQMNN